MFAGPSGERERHKDIERTRESLTVERERSLNERLAIVSQWKGRTLWLTNLTFGLTARLFLKFRGGPAACCVLAVLVPAGPHEEFKKGMTSGPKIPRE